MRERIAVVGAGAAAAGVVHALETDRRRDGEGDGVSVDVFDKARGVGGRAATRRMHGCRYDHGANYVKPGADDEFTTTLESLGASGLHDIEEPVWVHDTDGELGPGRDDDARKWTYEQGITQFAKRVFDASEARIRTETHIDALARDQTRETWTLTDAGGDTYGAFDAVVLTPPAPQTAALLDATYWDDPRLERIRAAAAAVEYRTIRTLVLHYDDRIDQPWFATVDPDQTHPVGWLSREECKPGHVPDGESLLIAQMSPEWSETHFEDQTDDAATEAAALVADLLDDDRYCHPDWADSQGWRYAIPENAAPEPAISAGEPAALYCAGDWLVGEGRVHLAFQNGKDVAARIHRPDR